ncbi:MULTISPECIES: polyribonucleotide nucleotidyltransferase [unclassified Bdellovibrio]|uniref:polyribonucleotide nucleotidyltransferase n=1 Tax=unclassified Bdellovibrio TaxID=2633795 RepID=UPI00115BA9FC|nr:MULTISPECIES: polyribonucleotide nucleotidyltransferase [unclassified Bdellovibrio]QDK45146.1 polyribonucleotide nucleotidyltransferase [Bdellovibrio sp. ZAP7]QLY26854.1 polyribonucleotide nucleotidyltransferase [Bdellovibrio sp. KM01]
MKTTVTTSVGGKQITIETGRMAKQADGSVLVSSGNNMVIVTAVSSKKPSEMDFFPLTVEYIEKYYATGKIPGGYFKREAKPTNDAVLIARLIDRPIRPSFPEGYRYETQVVATVLSADGSFPLEILASLGASAALHVSDIPFNGPTAAVQIARVDGQFIANPTPQQMEKSDMDMIVAGTRNGLLMVEGETKFISEADALAALKFGHQALIPLLNAQDELREKTGSVAKRAYTAPSIDADFKSSAEAFLQPKIAAALAIKEKQDRYAASAAAASEAEKTLLASITDKDLLKQRKKELNTIIEDLKYKEARSMILDRKVRIDGRNTTTVRPVANEVGILPRAHGSGLFTRGETQVLGTVTLGTGDDEQMVDSLLGVQKRKFMLHYNFPPYSVGEVGRMSGTSRREIGHGNLAERALKAVLPDHEKFPYTIRIVSEVLESNGSSSMGTVCSGLMALLDAGVPVKGNVAGVAMGLIKEGDRVAVLTDILGDEDHLGDMDFKVAGTAQGITAVQMDIKIDSVSFEVMEQALSQAKDGRIHILNEMEKVMKTPRGQISEFAPRIETIKIRPDKIREVIGSGGKVIRGITEATGVKIEIEDDGTIHIASADPEATKKAIGMINDIVAEAEVGKTYKGRVVKIAEFGAFVEILPNTQGLLHISEISNERVRAVTDVLKEGETIDVKVLEVDRAGRVKLSRKALLQQQ